MEDIHEEQPDYIEDPITTALKKLPSIKYLFPYQKLVVNNVLEASGYFSDSSIFDDDTDEIESRGFSKEIVILPTGAGKSLCFQVPSLLLKKPTLVLYPLLSLMADQERRLQNTNITAKVLRGGMTLEEKNNVFSLIRQAKVQMILTNPETACSPDIISRLQDAEIAHLVIDEAHCVSEWGDSFRPSYLKIGELQHILSPKVTTAFTATASPLVLDRVTQVLFNSEKAALVFGNPDRINIKYSVIPVFSKEHDLESLVRTCEKPCIIFSRSRKTTEQIALFLRIRLGIDDIYFYHAGLEKDEKKVVEDWFFTSKNGILSSTCAYGMGIDKSDIRTVIHYDITPSVESYLQESGRAGRDGLQSYAYLLYSKDDNKRLDGITNLKDKKRAFDMKAYAENTSTCRRNFLLKLLGSEEVYCEGCDVCDGKAKKQNLMTESILSFIKKNNRRYFMNEIALMVSDEPSTHRFENGLYKNVNHDEYWRTSDIEKALKALLRTKIICKGKYAWKDLLYIPNKNRTKYN